MSEIPSVAERFRVLLANTVAAEKALVNAKPEEVEELARAYVLVAHEFRSSLGSMYDAMGTERLDEAIRLLKEQDKA